MKNTNWISVKDKLPTPQQRVYVVCETRGNYDVLPRLQTIAMHIPYMTVKEGDFMDDQFWGDGDYNEKEDEFYTPEGWYEWQSEPDINWKLSGEVTHWMPLFEMP